MVGTSTKPRPRTEIDADIVRVERMLIGATEHQREFFQRRLDSLMAEALGVPGRQEQHESAG
jgi:hypothetical protein